MGGLLSGGAPLRGRSALELIVPTFDFRLAAEFWRISDHRLAALLYFIVGGTPAYRTEYLRGAAPSDRAHFDAWVVEHVLNPASPLFREVRALLAEDPALRDTGLYHTVLAAVAEGNATRGGIANRIERKAADISHHLTVLEDAGLLVREPDAFRENRSEYRITEPLVRFYHAIAGPVFERMCWVWAEDMADPQTFGGQPARVLSGVVRDPATRTSYEVDVAAQDAEGRILAIGEVKWGKRMDLGHLARLEKIAGVLESRDQRPRVLALFSGTGFSPDLAEAAAGSRGRVQLADLDRLYTGS